MESKKQTESILAKLMELDGLRPNKRLERQCGQQKVLSERYLRSIAFIGRYKNLSFKEISMDVDDQMPYEEDSSGGSKRSDEALEFYAKEADKVFQMFSLHNSTQKVDSTYPSFGGGDSHKLLRTPNQRNSVSYSNGMRRIGTYLDERRRDCRHFRGEAIANGSMGAHGVAKEVSNQLHQSVWHDYSKEFRSMSTWDEAESHDVSCGFDQSTSFLPVGNSNCRSMKFNVHKEWCLNLVNRNSSYCDNIKEVDSKSEETGLIPSDLNEFGEEDSVEDCPSTPLSSKTASSCSHVESVANKAIERVLDELPDMLQEIDSFRSRECKSLDALRQQVADNAVKSDTIFSDSVPKLHSISSAAHLCAPIHEFGMKAHKPISESSSLEAEETRFLSYVVDVLAELGHQPSEDLLSPCVFDSLEKKYGKDASWHKSERRLLFDRIKCGLSDMLCPQKLVSTRYKVRHFLRFKQGMSKVEVLNVLAEQEKEARAECEMSVGRDEDWVEFDEGIQIVAKEIEEALANELVEEIVSK